MTAAALDTKQNGAEESDLYQPQLEAAQRILDEATQDRKNSFKSLSKDKKILSDARKKVK